MGRDDLDPASDEAWCAAARSQVVAYLARQGLRHGEVGERPAWHVAPIVSVWAVESLRRPGWIGWWVIQGDLPTDYVPAGSIRHPRDAVRAFAEEWSEYVCAVRAGRPPAHFTIGSGPPSEDLLDLLERRARLLSEWAADDSPWHDPRP
jgi:hypothetical protein